MVRARDCPPNIEINAMRRPRSIAERARYLPDLSQPDDDRLSHEIFRLPLEDARTKARQFIDESPAGGYMTIVENWRQLSGGQIEFTVRRLQTARKMDKPRVGGFRTK